jgi:DNA-binding transcriptional LysR family regulator
MEIKHLHTFFILSKELNFTRAAEKLGYTQSNVTFHIKTLEQELHSPLFNRLGKTISLTDTGRNLLPMAVQMLVLEKNILSMQEDTTDRGTIRIGVCDSLCVNRLPKIIYEYKKEHPQVDISLEILKCSEFYDKLAEDQIDLAFTIGYLRKDANILYAAEKEETICVLSSPDFPFVRKPHLTAVDFAGVPLILAEKAAYYRINFEQDLAHHNITPYIMVETESIQAIKKLTEKNLGVCIMPKIAALEEIACQSLVILDYQCNYGIHSHIIWHKDKQLSSCQRNFLNFASDS